MAAAATNDIRPDDLHEIETIARNAPGYVADPLKVIPCNGNSALNWEFLQLLVKSTISNRQRVERPSV